MMFRTQQLSLAGLLLLGSLATDRVHAQGPMHPAEPTVNLGDTSFLDAIGGPGVLVEEMVDGDHSGNATDGTGRPVPGFPASNSISGNTHVSVLSQRRVFGASYGGEILQAVAHVNAGPESKVTGVGQFTLSPLILQWGEAKIGSFRFIQRFVLDFDLSTGEYRRTANLSLSNHAFDVHPYYAMTFYPSRHLESSWRVHYLWNAANNTPSVASGAHSTQAGQAIHFNATISYRLPHGLWVGTNGYYLTQITDPKMNGQPLSNSPERIGAIGPGAVWDMGHWLLFANAYHEVGALNRPEGNKVVLRLQWIPSRKGSTDDHKRTLTPQ